MTAPPRPGPLPPYRTVVRPEWVDYNGHLSEAYYVLVFGHATDALMAAVGLGPEDRARTGCSLYTVESHLRYLREVPEGAGLTVRTRVLGADAKRVRFTHEMSVDAPDGRPDGAGPAATTELLALHVDQSARPARTAPFPTPVRTRLTTLTEPAPPWAGRAIGGVPAVCNR